MSIPAISVIIPVFNREAEIGNCLTSLLQQDFHDFEAVVVNDGSTDGTATGVESIGDPRIRVIHLPENRGHSAAGNVGIRAALSPLICFLDSDDEFLPHKLSFIHRFFLEHDDKQAVVASLMDLKAWLSEHTAIQPIWRLTAGLDQILEVSNSSAIPLVDQLANVDAVISTPSNVILESMAHGLPVALLDYTNSPQDIRAAWSITAKAHLSDAMEGLLAADPCYMRWQYALLADQLECQTESTPRVIALMESLLSGKPCLGQPSSSRMSKEAELQAEIAHLRQILTLSSTQVAYHSLCEFRRWLGRP